MTAARRFSTMLALVGTLAGLAGLAGCAAAAQDASADSATVGTVSAVGELPESIPETETASPATEVPSTDSVVATDPTDATDTFDPSDTSDTAVPTTLQIGARAAGNRLLMIGDSVTASISQRYGGEACKALVPLGWKVEVDAETGRFVDFGKIVLDKRLDAGWDAAVIFLGTNYGEDKEVYKTYMRNILLRLVPRPTVVINTSLYQPEQQQVNDAINELAAEFTSVTVIDWATVSQDPSYTGADSIHLTEAGRRALAYQLAATIGEAPGGPDGGECLKTQFRNDSAGSPDGPPGNQTTTKTTIKYPTSTTSASTASSTATTAVGQPGSTTATTSSGTGSTTATTQPSTTAAPSSSAVVTTPTLPPVVPTTAAPTTAAPTTQPATTATPTTPLDTKAPTPTP